MKCSWTFRCGYSFHDVWSFVLATSVTEKGLLHANCREPPKLIAMKTLHQMPEASAQCLSPLMRMTKI